MEIMGVQVRFTVLKGRRTSLQPKTKITNDENGKQMRENENENENENGKSCKFTIKIENVGST